MAHPTPRAALRCHGGALFTGFHTAASAKPVQCGGSVYVDREGVKGPGPPERPDGRQR